MDENSDNFNSENENTEKETRSYDVGYGKPPEDTRFKKGQSGNKKGRPKGSKNKSPNFPINILNDLVVKECMEDVTIHTANKQAKVKKIEAVIKATVNKAIKGDHRSQKLILETFKSAEKEILEFSKEKLETAIIYREGALREIEQAKMFGQPDPDILPHPNHILIDPRTGEIKVIGPMDENEKKDWDIVVARRILIQKKIKQIKEILSTGRDQVSNKPLTRSTKNKMHNDLERFEKKLSILREIIPDDYYIPPSTMEFVNSSPDIWSDESFK